MYNHVSHYFTCNCVLGEKYVMTFFGILSFADQGSYAYMRVQTNVAGSKDVS